MPAARAASIPVTPEAIQTARRAVSEFTTRGLPAPALLDLVAHATVGHRITPDEIPTPAGGSDPADLDPAVALHPSRS